MHRHATVVVQLTWCFEWSDSCRITATVGSASTSCITGGGGVQVGGWLQVGGLRDGACVSWWCCLSLRGTVWACGAEQLVVLFFIAWPWGVAVSRWVAADRWTHKVNPRDWGRLWCKGQGRWWCCSLSYAVPNAVTVNVMARGCGVQVVWWASRWDSWC